MLVLENFYSRSIFFFFFLLCYMECNCVNELIHDTRLSQRMSSEERDETVWSKLLQVGKRFFFPSQWTSSLLNKWIRQSRCKFLLLFGERYEFKVQGTHCKLMKVTRKIWDYLLQSWMNQSYINAAIFIIHQAGHANTNWSSMLLCVQVHTILWLG